LKRKIRKSNAKKNQLPSLKTVSAPISKTRVIRNLGQPKVQSLGKRGDVIVVHKEFISDLVSSATAAAFSCIGIPINPGNSAMFPWLSSIADKFESYVFRSLKFFFETDAPSTAPGSVLLAVDYDPTEPIPTSKQELMSKRAATRTAAWTSVAMPCVKEDLHKRKSYFVNSDIVSTTYYNQAANREDIADIRLNDTGEFLIASSNCASSQQLGELYVEYEVELLTPELANANEVAYFSWYNTEDATNSINVTTSKPYGDRSSNQVDSASRDPIWAWITNEWRYEGTETYSSFYCSRPGSYLIEAELLFWTTTAGSPLTFTVANLLGNGDLRQVSNFPTGSGASLASFHYEAYIIISPQPPNIRGDIGGFDTVVGGTGALSPSGSKSFMKIIRIPDYFTDGINEYPGPVGGLRSTSRRRKNRDRHFCLSSEPSHERVSFQLAGNASSVAREKSSTDEEVGDGPDKGQDTPEGVVPFSSSGSEKGLRTLFPSRIASGRFHHTP